MYCTQMETAILSQVGTGGHGTRKFDTDELLKLPILILSQEKLKKFQIAATDCRASLAGISKTKEKLEQLFDVLLYRAFSGELTAKWRQAHMRELLAEMEEQAKALNLRDNADPLITGIYQFPNLIPSQDKKRI